MQWGLRTQELEVLSHLLTLILWSTYFSRLIVLSSVFTSESYGGVKKFKHTGLIPEFPVEEYRHWYILKLYR